MIITVRTIGIDLGTSNTFICEPGRGIIKRAPSVISVSFPPGEVFSANRGGGEVIATGLDAKKMIDRTPPGIRAITPLSGGVVCDEEKATLMIQTFLEEIGALSVFNRPYVAFSVPCGITGVERRAVENAAYEVGLKDVYLFDSPINAAVGAGLSVDSARGIMIVDIGGGITEAAVISHGGIAASDSVRIAGNDLDAAIIDYIGREKNLLIGRPSAEMLKCRIGSVHPSADTGSMRVLGRNIKKGNADSAVINSSDIRYATEKTLRRMINVIINALESTPPELSSDIYDRGMILTGGGALLGGLAKLINETTGLRVSTAKNPLDCVCLGICKTLEE